MPREVLRVLPRGTARVPDYAALLGNRVNRFHGWVADKTIGKPFQNSETKQQDRHLAHVKRLGEPVVIPTESEHIGEYIRHLRDKDLWPADAFTAQFAGVPFDPDFGDEHGDAAKAEQDAELAEIRELHGVPAPVKAEAAKAVAKAVDVKAVA